MHFWIAFFLSYVLLQNIGVAALQTWFLRRRKSAPLGLVIFVWVWAVLMGAIFLLQAVEPNAGKPFIREWLYFPLAIEMIWNLLFLQVLFPGMILAALIVRLRERRKPAPSPQDEGISRRKFLYLVTYGAAPAVALGMGVHGDLSRYDLRVREFRIPIAGLPPELEGFTIAHVSDLHSGLFVGPKRLRLISDMTNDLKADLITVTGDIINREMTEFSDALASLQRMRAPHGIYLCEGNHDVIPGDGLMVAACAANRLPMLYNTCVTLPVRGRRLLLGGLPWMGGSDFEGRPELVADLFPARQEGDVRILMAHHPHMFDIAQSADLVLSGHTHGGQIMFGDVGLGSIRFKYCSGRFQRGSTTMIVSNGCGDWFPCRIGAPAEIGLLRLTAANGSS